MTPPSNPSNPVIQQNRAAYSRIAGEWLKRQDTEFDDYFHRRCRNLFIKHLKGRRVLDAGCGLGLDSSAFVSCGLEVTAADIVPDFLMGIQSMAQDVRLVAMDLTASCFRESSFDGIFACASFLHVPHELSRLTIETFEKILAPGGILFLGHVSSSKGLRCYQVDDLLIRNNPAFCFCHTQEEMVSMIEEAGMKVLALEQNHTSKHPSPCAAQNGLEPYQMVAGK